MKENQPNRNGGQLFQSICAMFCGIGIALLIGACSGRATTSDTNSLQITLLPAPEGIEGTAITVLLADSTGAPVTDATVSLEGNMSHAGMAPISAAGVQDAAEEGIGLVLGAGVRLGNPTSSNFESIFRGY